MERDSYVMSPEINHDRASTGDLDPANLGAQRAMDSALSMQQDLTVLLEDIARNRPDLITTHRTAVLNTIVAAAINMTDADMGNIQLVDPVRSALYLEGHRGFARPFLSFFNRVDHGRTACGVAFTRRAQVMVEDVTESSIFLRTPGLEVILDAGVRAVQSTPLVGRSGDVLGILSTHWRTPRNPGSAELHLVKAFAAKAALWMERRLLRAGVPGAVETEPVGCARCDSLFTSMLQSAVEVSRTSTNVKRMIDSWSGSDFRAALLENRSYLKEYFVIRQELWSHLNVDSSPQWPWSATSVDAFDL